MAPLEKAIELVARAHAGQRDKGGVSYILHPLRVMLRLDSEEAQIVAVLHDTIEGTDVTADDLRKAGFSDGIIEAVNLVTHEKREPYVDYVCRCARHPIARQVKRADLEENSRLDRTLLRPATLARDLKRLARYTLSYKFLTGQINEQEYRAAMKGQD